VVQGFGGRGFSCNYQIITIMIGKRIQILRVLHGTTQQCLAAEIGISQSRLSRIENGGASIGFDLVVRIAAYFKVELEVFLADGPSTPAFSIVVNRAGGQRPPLPPPDGGQAPYPGYSLQ
jgi:transcriptional regulator with XRE-family HTH domain